MDNGFYRQRAQKRLIVIGAVIACALVLYWLFPSFFSWKKLADIQSSAEQFAVKEIQKQVSTPPPLRAPQSTATPSSVLTRSGIIVDTNLERTKNGALPALSENTTLDAIATARLHDMFKKQYFAHVAPDGGSAVKIADAIGYDYLSLGENIALGNYAGDKGVVTAWMNSPGHRANILSTHYTEIGVAAGEGIFEGEDTWIAVQVFARPASDCPSPDAALKTALDATENQLLQMNTELQAEQAQLEAKRITKKLMNTTNSRINTMHCSNKSKLRF
jgi:uncharacterized protein YkwD